jgi:hypothetical protein
VRSIDNVLGRGAKKLVSVTCRTKKGEDKVFVDYEHELCSRTLGAHIGASS